MAAVVVTIVEGKVTGNRTQETATGVQGETRSQWRVLLIY